MKQFEKLLDMIETIMKYVVTVLTVTMFSVQIIDIIRRYVFNTNWAWSDELVRYIVVWMAFVGGAAAYRAGGMPCFDLLKKALKPKKAAYVNLVNHLVVFFLSAVFCYFGICRIMSPAIFKAKSLGLGVPMAVPYSGIPIGMFLTMLFGIDAIYHAVLEIKKLRNEGGEEG